MRHNAIEAKETMRTRAGDVAHYHLDNADLTPPVEERSQAVTCYVNAGLDKRRHTQRPMEIAPPLDGRSMRLNFPRHFHSCWGFSAVQMSQWQ